MSKKVQNITNKDCLIGYSGFIGKELQVQKKFDYLFNSKNISKIKNMTFNNTNALTTKRCVKLLLGLFPC